MEFRIVIKNSLLLIAIVIFSITSCNDKQSGANINEVNTVNTIKANTQIEVVSTGMNFEIPSELPSGWTTFIYDNKSSETHFFIFEKMPNGITINNYNQELVPPIKAAFTYLLEDKIDAAMKEFDKIPAWWSDVKMGGGVGLISPNRQAESTVYLHPGTYVMECYVRMANGMPHAFYGMMKEIKVTEIANNQNQPKADYKISVGSDTGIAFQDSIPVGKYQFEVTFKDQKSYETLLGHDVNLVKLNNSALLDTVSTWINAANINAFRTPVPEGLTFMGGIEDLEAGEIGYFKARLDEGNYVLISEIPDALARNMYKTFSVYK